MKETGTTSFLDRFALTQRLDEMLVPFLEEYGFEVQEFGHPLILQGNSWMMNRLKRLKTKASSAALMVKFTPDFIVVKRGHPKGFFLLDTKTSITPVFFAKQIERIRNHSKRRFLGREDVEDVEREAWFIYNSSFPNDRVAIVMALPYNPNLVLAEWVSNVKCMWCYYRKTERGPEPYQCRECPIFTSIRGNFGVVKNFLAGGSGTPHTNIDLGSMRTLSEFLGQEFGIEVDSDYLEIIIDEVKTWDLNKPAGRVNWTQFNNVIRDLQRTCPWLKGRNPTKKEEPGLFD